VGCVSIYLLSNLNVNTNYTLGEIQRDCPYYYELKALLGERTNVADKAIANSETPLNTHVLRSRKRRRAVSPPSSAEEEEEPEDLSDAEKQEDSVAFDQPPALDLAALGSADSPVDPDLSSFHWQALLNGEFEDDELQVLSSAGGLPNHMPSDPPLASLARSSAPAPPRSSAAAGSATTVAPRSSARLTSATVPDVEYVGSVKVERDAAGPRAAKRQQTVPPPRSYVSYTGSLPHQKEGRSLMFFFQGRNQESDLGDSLRGILGDKIELRKIQAQSDHDLAMERMRREQDRKDNDAQARLQRENNEVQARLAREDNDAQLRLAREDNDAQIRFRMQREEMLVNTRLKLLEMGKDPSLAETLCPPIDF
jgi:hypothetical protein